MSGAVVTLTRLLDRKPSATQWNLPPPLSLIHQSDGTAIQKDVAKYIAFNNLWWG